MCHRSGVWSKVILLIWFIVWLCCSAPGFDASFHDGWFVSLIVSIILALGVGASARITRS